jgi:hypothetical protein
VHTQGAFVQLFDENFGIFYTLRYFCIRNAEQFESKKY